MLSVPAVVSIVACAPTGRAASGGRGREWQAHQHGETEVVDAVVEDGVHQVRIGVGEPAECGGSVEDAVHAPLGQEPVDAVRSDRRIPRATGHRAGRGPLPVFEGAETSVPAACSDDSASGTDPGLPQLVAAHAVFAGEEREFAGAPDDRAQDPHTREW